MGIFSGIFKSRDAPTNRTAGSAYSFFLGQSAAGKRVNERSAMQTSAVYACVRVISESVASLPLHLYKYNENGGKEKAINHPLYHLLHDEPNPEMTAYSFFEVALTHLLLWGNSYSQIIRNGKGEVIGLYPLMPDRMMLLLFIEEPVCVRMHPPQRKAAHPLPWKRRNPQTATNCSRQKCDSSWILCSAEWNAPFC